jgi:hypothetical protein
MMKRRIYFFAGGEYREKDNNAFTANFIRDMETILGDNFILIRDIYHERPLANVVWALNRAQKPLEDPAHDRLVARSVAQIDESCPPSEKPVLVSSSYGSVMAAQAACLLAGQRKREGVQAEPFDLALGASLVSKESHLYRQLLQYRDEGLIGKILYDELQDEGDNSVGIGGRNRLQGYLNALGICFPFLTRKYSGPSFLNTDPITGHIHRVRSKSIGKAHDFIRIILIDSGLGGEEGKRKAEEVVGNRQQAVAG